MSQVSTAALPLWHHAFLFAPATAAGLAAVAASRAPSTVDAWRWARRSTATMAVAATAATAIRMGTSARAGMIGRSDTVGVAMLALVAFIGWVVIRYSQAYLSGDNDERPYVVRLLATLAAVATVVVANNLIVLVVAWTATSLALHGLLTHYRDRPVAVAVAHKKFLLARTADLCMLGAVAAFGASFGTLRIDRITSHATTAASLSPGARIGIALVAGAALLKCAQLPFHGWLIQVMEAPTPVSALLHAGVVNLGGFVLLRFAPMVDRAVETRTLLVLVGTATAVVASLVMITRVSIKVSLAWSTCAQMGFMLMQCGLGLWEMAVLHLLAHSLYKAHAFLGAGGAVRRTRQRQLASETRPPTVRSIGVATAIAIGGTTTIAWAWNRLPFAEPHSGGQWLFTGIVALALVPLVRAPSAHRGQVGRAAATALIPLVVAVAYLTWHESVAHLIPSGAAAPPALLVMAASAFVLLFVVQSVCAIAPTGRLATALYPWIYGGLFLDEAFTRVAFRLWPPPPARHRASPLPRPEAALAAELTPHAAPDAQPQLPTHPLSIGSLA